VGRRSRRRVGLKSVDNAVAHIRLPESDQRFAVAVRRTFGRDGAAQVLRAYRYVLNRKASDASEDLRVADILLGQRADPVVVTAALLTPAHRRGDLPRADIATRFGAGVAELVAGAARQGPLAAGSDAQRIGDLRRWLTSISVNVRTLVLRVGLRLSTLERLAEVSPEEAPVEHGKALARETLQLYVPLADRMGMGALRTRLEDASFRLLQPSAHAEMERSVAPIRAEDRVCLSLMEDGVAQMLEDHGVEATIQSRTKGLYSIYRKMRRLDIPLDEVMDRIGLRLIVPSVEACYHVLGLLHTRFRPVPGTFDDYVGFPKANGYQSLHTCVYPVPDVTVKPIEFQIRTEEMHREAEFGVAAHWLYKDQAEAEAEDRRQLERLRKLLSEGRDSVDVDAFLDRLHRQVRDERVVVFGGDGRSLRLPANATVGDVARRMNQDGTLRQPIAVNGAVREPDYPIRDGDTIQLPSPGQNDGSDDGDALPPSEPMGQVTP